MPTDNRGFAYPDVVDFAFQIIGMQRRIEDLEAEVAHYKHMHDLHCESIKKADEFRNKSMGVLLTDILDPDSVINKGHEALLREEMEDS